MNTFKSGSVVALVIISLSAAALAQVAPTAGQSAGSVPATVRPLKAQGIENFFQLTDRIYSGSTPESDAAFAELEARGIKSIITVDGSQPDVEMARKHGMKYVHLPIGYDGVPVDQGARLVKAAESIPGPIFVHCHHGLHRGPAGAAVICMGVAGWTPEQAESWLRLAGTATNYTGLYKSVANFHPPSPETLKNLPADFPEKSKVSPFVEVMIQVDERADHLKLIKKAGYRPPAANPNLDPAQEALLLDELFRELQRSPIAEKRGPDFMAKLTAAEQSTAALGQILKTAPIAGVAADTALQRVIDSCAACHKAHRN